MPPGVGLLSLFLAGAAPRLSPSNEKRAAALFGAKIPW
jgi:hypothetical protein